MITLNVTPETAALIATLDRAGVFQQKNGSVTLEFDAAGTLMEIKKTEVCFKRGRKVINTLTGVAIVSST